jgi:prepilin-type N-terminal cleavage/methylation domain-containing protein
VTGTQETGHFNKRHLTGNALKRASAGRSQKGFTLLETVIAMAILCVIAVAFLTALATSSRALIVTDERETALNLAKSQMEYVMNLAYDDTAPYSYTPGPIPAEYSGLWSAAISVENIPATAPKIPMQKISVTIIKKGTPDKSIIMTAGNATLQDYKVHP